MACAWSSGHFEAKDQYLADALVDLGDPVGTPGAPGVCVVPACEEAGRPVEVPGTGVAARPATLCEVHRDQMTYLGWHLHSRGDRWEWASPSHCAPPIRRPARE